VSENIYFFKKECANMIQGGQKVMIILLLYGSICSIDKIMLMNLKFEVLSSFLKHIRCLKHLLRLVISLISFLQHI